ncbi:DUF3536 domain-containing protein [Candidatus Dependentiae bacterium]|nr:DUF3536 domain-containing protein [Candidatus Dependentiae bacterium]
MTTKYFCLHSHFYQPPRENPWLNIVETQPSAFPSHDWNDRITSECYYPNGFGKILNGNSVLKIINNYAYMNFNFGPTLLVWLERNNPVIYERIIQGDKLSRKIFEGCGGAIAQVYNHIIMPLAARRDKIIQIEWGIKDFEHRFGRYPEGMWLAETAADSETLEILADYGIKYTVLSPYQAHSFFENNRWCNIHSGNFDVTIPYKLHLKNNKSIIIVFYEAHLSKAAAFENILENGDNFMNAINSKFKNNFPHNQLITMATDGETYGHHKKFGELALSYVFNNLENSKKIKVCNISYYLSKNNYFKEIKIHEKSSWSCAHGVGRWSDNCGCKIDNSVRWNQKWRFHLRNAMNSLKYELDIIYDSELKKYVTDEKTKHQILSDYILLANNHNLTEKNVIRFLKNFNLEIDFRDKIISLLEMQKYSQYMFTSCGWFFDEISGLEATQIIKYAYYAIEIAKKFNKNLEPFFINCLRPAESNLPEYKNGENIFHLLVKPSKFDKPLIAAIAAAYDMYKYETSKKNILFNYDINIIFSKVVHNKKNISYVIELKSPIDFPESYYLVLINKTIKFTEKYSVKCLSDPAEYIEKIKNGENIEFDNIFSFSDFPQDARIKLLKTNVVINLRKYSKFFRKFYDSIDFYKKSIENPDIYLPPVVKSIMQEVIYTRLYDSIEKNDIETLQKLVEPSVIWNVQFYNSLIHKEANKTLSYQLNLLLSSITYDLFDKKIYTDFIKLIDVYRKINLHTNLPEIQDEFYNFYTKFSAEKNQYGAEVHYIIEKLREHIMYK